MELARKEGAILSALIVEDEREIRETVRLILEKLSYFSYIVEAEDGSDGINKVSFQRFDLVITDLEMPKVEGISFLKSIISHPNMKNCAVIVLSASVTSDRLQTLIGLGVRKVITKPFSIDTLEEEVKKALFEQKKSKLVVLAS